MPVQTRNQCCRRILQWLPHCQYRRTEDRYLSSTHLSGGRSTLEVQPRPLPLRLRTLACTQRLRGRKIYCCLPPSQRSGYKANAELLVTEFTRQEISLHECVLKLKVEMVHLLFNVQHIILGWARCTFRRQREQTE